MKRSAASSALVVCMCILGLSFTPRAQNSGKAPRFGMPQDWSQHHILFTRDGLLSNPGLLSSEPRVLHQMMLRLQTSGAHVPASGDSVVAGPIAPQRDWNVSLNLARVAANMFPAKYSFDPGAPPSCANDYVVFGLSRVGGANQANLIAFNDLYSGTPAGLCGSAPSVLFAYNISTVPAAGRILTSPILSLDGKKVAFVESGNTGGGGPQLSVFHVLTWATGPGNGTAANAPAVPGVGNTASMTSLTFAAALDTRSSPWIDYKNDVVYVGADDGTIYKIVNVFKGTPALGGSPFPVTIAAGSLPSSPVLDNRLGLLMIGSQNGSLYNIDITTGAVRSLAIGRSGGRNPGILAPPIVDLTSGTSFAVSANDGTSGVLVQVDVASMTRMAFGRIGQASHGGTTISLFQPAFSNDYFINPSSGVVRLCGTGAANNTPWQYGFGFTGITMNSTPVFSAQLVTSATARCTGWVEFFNPNIGPSGTDFFFFGLTQNCTGGGTPGCVVSRDGAGNIATANVTGGPTGIIVDNYSTADQASSIYFTGATAPNLAFKFTQNGLQ